MGLGAAGVGGGGGDEEDTGLGHCLASTLAQMFIQYRETARQKAVSDLTDFQLAPNP